MSKKPSKPSEPQILHRKLSDYIPDDNNANVGTERGLDMIEKGLNKLGVGRSIVADKNDKIPAGNKTLEAAQNAGITDVIEITTNGHALIVHKREDWDLDDLTGPAREYAHLDNRASEVGLSWDANKIVADLQGGADLSLSYQQWEMNNLLNVNPDPVDRNGMWQGMPEYEQNDLEVFQTIKVHFNTQADREAFAQLIGQVVNEETKFVYYPKLVHANRKAHQVVDEL